LVNGKRLPGPSGKARQPQYVKIKVPTSKQQFAVAKLMASVSARAESLGSAKPASERAVDGSKRLVLLISLIFRKSLHVAA
jgi:hypothetical protein